MLRELSLKAKRRAARDNPKPTTSDVPKIPIKTSNLSTSTLDTSSTSLSNSSSNLSTLSSLKSPSTQPSTKDISIEGRRSRGLSALPRRLSRGPGSFLSNSAAAARARRATNVEKSNDVSPEQPSLLRVTSGGRGSQVVSRLRRRSSNSKSSSPDKSRRSSPRHFTKRTGVTSPLESVDDLLRWRPTGAAAKCVSSVPLSEAAIKRYVRSGSMAPPVPTSKIPTTSSVVSSQRPTASAIKRIQPPRLLLCHDYRGGYEPWEASATGVSGEDCPDDNILWRFNHWAYVDIFVYFSHNCVTIPPVGYINAAHRHGSLVLGTLIFEWEAGAKQLPKILVSYKTRAKAASQLAAIAKFYGFDGWLVNVECQLASSAAASDLAAFVGDLTRTTRKVLGQASEVIWYDSVTRDGSLSYQNELNAENEQFFKAAGSVFTNYHWDRNAPVRSAVKAGIRRTNVFTGIDIHGRNTFGGGGFHTHLALRAIKQGGTSAAIFAPAWTVESCPPNVSDPRELEERFWTGPSGKFGRESVAQYFKERPVITDLPFSTNFDPGWGPHLVRNGTIKDRRRYFNMAQQQIQPSFMRTVTAAGDGTAVKLSLSHEYAYNGSASVKTQFAFSDSRMLTGSYAILRLFVASLAFPGRISSRLSKTSEVGLKLSYDYRAECPQDPESAANDFGLVLFTTAPQSAILLVSKSSKWSSQGGPRRAAPRLQILGKFVNVEIVTPKSDKRAFGARNDEEDTTGWMTRTYILDNTILSGRKITDVMVIVGQPPQQPISVRASPFMTPSLSRMGSRPVSRVVSRNTSRIGSRMGSRAASPPRGSGLNRNDDNGDALQRYVEEALTEQEQERNDSFGSNLLQQYRDSFSNRARSDNPHPGLDHGSEAMGFDRRQDSAPGVFQRSDIFSRRTQTPRRTAFLDRDEDMHRNIRGTYANNFQVEGSIEFEQIENSEMTSFGSLSGLSARSSRFATPGGSRPMSRFGSRTGSVNGSASVSLAASLAASRTGSLAGSRAPSAMGSRAGSRMGSRFASPSRTPMTGGGGALPRDSYGRRMSMRQTSGGSSSSLRLISRDEAELENETQGSRSSVALNELKTVLMSAAVSMAGEDPEENGANGQVISLIKTVYLGGLRIEEIRETTVEVGMPRKAMNDRPVIIEEAVTTVSSETENGSEGILQT